MENDRCEESVSRAFHYCKMTYIACCVFVPPLLQQWLLLMLVAPASLGIFCKYDPAISYRRVGAYARFVNYLPRSYMLYSLGIIL